MSVESSTNVNIRPKSESKDHKTDRVKKGIKRKKISGSVEKGSQLPKPKKEAATTGITGSHQNNTDGNKLSNKENLKSKLGIVYPSIQVTENEGVSDDVPTDDLIKKLSDLRDRCQKPSHHTPKGQAEKQKVQFNSAARCSDSETVNSCEVVKPTSKKYKPKRKRGMPKKRMKVDGNGKNMSPVKNGDVPVNISAVDSEVATDEDIEEPTLTIDESKRKKKSKLASIPIPDELMEMILKSGIDDVLEEKAEKRKLTATHVKNIIKHVVMDENVVRMVRNSVLGISDDPAQFEPKLTRAKTKELYEKQLQEVGSIQVPKLSLWMGSGADPNVMGSSVRPDTKSLITIEFPDEEDDEEYQPGLDEQLMSDEENSSKFGSPASTSQSSFIMTPNSTPSVTPKCTSRGKYVNIANSTSVQRSLDFNKPKDPFGQIGSRTRSKYPMTDTPIEYLESQFRPPDITPDMYDMECDDEVWKQFLLEYIKPPQENAGEVVEDDESVDPEYNLLQDAEQLPNVDDLHEEMRGDKGVRVTKKEYNQLIEEFLDTFDVEPEEQLENTFTEPEKSEVSRYESHSSLETPDSAAHDSFENNPSAEYSYSQHHPHHTSSSHQYSTRQFVDQPAAEVWQHHVTVTYLIPQFTQHQISVLESQLALHVQLLTTAVLCTNHKLSLNYIKEGATALLHNMVDEGKASKPNDHSLFHAVNLQAAIDTVRIFEESKDKVYSTEEREIIRDDDVPSFPHHFARDTGRLAGFPPYLREIFLNSSAFLFPQHLPPGLFHGNLLKRRGRFRMSEYWLLASCFKELVPKVKNFHFRWRTEHSVSFNQDLYDLCVKIGKSGLFYATGHQIAQKVQGLILMNKIHKNFEENPIVRFIKTGSIELPPAVIEPVYKKAPCCIKDMELKVLPRPFITYVKMHIKKTLENPSPEPFNPNSIKNILIVQDTFGTKIILPPSIQQPLFLGNSATVTSGSQTVSGYPTYCFFRKEIKNTGLVHKAVDINPANVTTAYQALPCNGNITHPNNQTSEITPVSFQNQSVDCNGYTTYSNISYRVCAPNAPYVNSTLTYSSVTTDLCENLVNKVIGPKTTDTVDDIGLNYATSSCISADGAEISKELTTMLTSSGSLGAILSTSASHKVFVVPTKAPAKPIMTKSNNRKNRKTTKLKKNDDDKPSVSVTSGVSETHGDILMQAILDSSMKDVIDDSLSDPSLLHMPLIGNTPVKEGWKNVIADKQTPVKDSVRGKYCAPFCQSTTTKTQIEVEVQNDENCKSSPSSCLPLSSTSTSEICDNSHSVATQRCNANKISSPDAAAAVTDSLGTVANNENSPGLSASLPKPLMSSSGSDDNKGSSEGHTNKHKSCHSMSEVLATDNLDESQNIRNDDNVIIKRKKEFRNEKARLHEGNNGVLPLNGNRNESVVIDYIHRVKSALRNGSKDNKKLFHFISVLQKLSRNFNSLKRLHNEVSQILCEHPDLVDEFTMFLSPSQARKIGKSDEHKLMKSTREFINELESLHAVKSQHRAELIKDVKLLLRKPLLTCDEAVLSLKHFLEPCENLHFIIKKHFKPYIRSCRMRQNSSQSESAATSLKVTHQSQAKTEIGPLNNIYERQLQFNKREDVKMRRDDETVVSNCVKENGADTVNISELSTYRRNIISDTTSGDKLYANTAGNYSTYSAPLCDHNSDIEHKRTESICEEIQHIGGHEFTLRNKLSHVMESEVDKVYQKSDTVSGVAACESNQEHRVPATVTEDTAQANKEANSLAKKFLNERVSSKEYDIADAFTKKVTARSEVEQSFKKSLIEKFELESKRKVNLINGSTKKNGDHENEKEQGQITSELTVENDNEKDEVCKIVKQIQSNNNSSVRKKCLGIDHGKLILEKDTSFTGRRRKLNSVLSGNRNCRLSAAAVVGSSKSLMEISPETSVSGSTRKQEFISKDTAMQSKRYTSKHQSVVSQKVTTSSTVSSFSDSCFDSTSPSKKRSPKAVMRNQSTIVTKSNASPTGSCRMNTGNHYTEKLTVGNREKKANREQRGKQVTENQREKKDTENQKGQQESNNERANQETRKKSRSVSPEIWSRDDDTVLLTLMKRVGFTEMMYSIAVKELGTKTKKQIRCRLNLLLSLLMENKSKS